MAITNNIFPLPSSEPDDLPSKESDETNQGGDNPALGLIRQKLANMYEAEPPAQEEEIEIEQLGALSKHQKFIQDLMDSDQDIAKIQTAWHNYYQGLPDEEKHEVWQEFYANHKRGSKLLNQPKPATKPSIDTNEPNYSKHAPKVSHSPMGANVYEPSVKHSIKPDLATIANLKKHLLNTISSRGKLSKKHHFQSLLFGVGMGMLVIFILMFGFFNERFIAPFITPSKTISDTPIIIDPTANNVVSSEPLIIIPKINVEIPVVYDVTSIDNAAISEGLMRGVLHYPTSPVPGQDGNVVVVGHSSNNIFNRGKYKFAFVLLSRLEVGDTFMLNYSSKRYIYKVYTKKIVPPYDVSVLGPTEKTATATLITCDPPGTANNRLVVIGEQISPTSDKNIAAAPSTTVIEQPAEVPGNAESLFHRLFGWIWD